MLQSSTFNNRLPSQALKIRQLNQNYHDDYIIADDQELLADQACLVKVDWRHASASPIKCHLLRQLDSYMQTAAFVAAISFLEQTLYKYAICVTLAKVNYLSRFE